MDIGQLFVDLATESGFAGLFTGDGWQNLVMIIIALVLLFLGIVKKFEPLLLVGIAFGMLLTNLPLGEVYAIVTKNDMRTVKRLGPSSNPDNYTLVPTNKSPEYGIQELPKNMILKIFEVMGCMKRL